MHSWLWIWNNLLSLHVSCHKTEGWPSVIISYIKSFESRRILQRQERQKFMLAHARGDGLIVVSSIQVSNRSINYYAGVWRSFSFQVEACCSEDEIRKKKIPLKGTVITLLLEFFRFDSLLQGWIRGFPSICGDYSCKMLLISKTTRKHSAHYRILNNGNWIPFHICSPQSKCTCNRITI